MSCAAYFIHSCWMFNVSNFQSKLLKLLVASLCPSIYGNELVKAGLLLGLFGGAVKFSSSRDKVPVRGDPHVSSFFFNELLAQAFFLTSTAEKTKTQGQNSSKKLKEKTQPLGSTLLKFVKLKKKTHLLDKFSGLPLNMPFLLPNIFNKGKILEMF